jgi:Tfp pilus assembly protein PilV
MRFERLFHSQHKPKQQAGISILEFMFVMILITVIAVFLTGFVKRSGNMMSSSEKSSNQSAQSEMSPSLTNSKRVTTGSF